MAFVVSVYHPDDFMPVNDYEVEATSIDEAVAQVTETMGLHHVFEDGADRIVVVPFGMTYVVQESTW